MKSKSLLYLCAVVLLLLLPSCSEKTAEVVTPAETPRLLTFGFYAADNAGMLSDDYISQVTTSSPSRISIALPPLVDCTSLIARFTTPEGQSVWVNDVEQQNGITSHDFSLPIDYYVTDGQRWQRYEVVVTRRSGSSWETLPTWKHNSIYSISHLAVSPTDNSLYAAFKSRKNLDNGEEDLYVHVLRLTDDDEWKPAATSSHRVYSSYLGFDISASGIPYISYPNYDLSPYSTFVERITPQGTCEPVGENLENAQANYIGFAALSDDCLISSMVGNTSATYYRTNATSIYNGKDWQVGLGPCGSLTVYKCTMTKYRDKAYLAIMERATGYAIHIYEYAEGRWTEIEGYQEPGVSNGIAAGCFKLTTDQEGNLYVLTDDDASGAYLVRLKKYDIQTQKWSVVSGNSTIIDGHDSHTQACAAIAPNGTPFICYRDIPDHSYFKCISLDPDTRQWTEPVTICTDPVNGDISMVFTSSSIGYASYVDSSNQLRLFRYGR